MKKYLFAFFLFSALLGSKTYAINRVSAIDSTIKMLPDGRYYADVSYYNFANNISAQYNLKLKVKDGFVTVLWLSNGGIVHNGINSEGYQFTGGKIKVSKNRKSGKLEYSAQLSISTGGSISTYNIDIEKEAADEQ